MGSVFRKPGLPPAEAFFGLLAAASAADGSNSAPEMAALGRIVKRVEPFASMSADDVTEMRKRVLVVLKDSDQIRHVVEQYAPHVAPEARAACYALCLEVVQADGIADAREADFLGHVCRALGVGEENATRIERAVRGGQVLHGVTGGQMQFGPPVL